MILMVGLTSVLNRHTPLQWQGSDSEGDDSDFEPSDVESEDEEDEIASGSDDESGEEGDNSNPHEVRRRGAAFLPFHFLSLTSSLRPTTLLGRWNTRMVHESLSVCWHALGFVQKLRSPESEFPCSDHSSKFI